MFSNLRDEVKQEILGVLLVALTVLVYIGLFSPTSAGFGEVVRRVLSGAFGDAQFYVPALIGLVGLLCIFQQGGLFAGARALGWAMGLVICLGWLHRFRLAYDGYEFDAIAYGWGGGLIGATVTWGLRQALGPLGRDVTLVALTLVSFLLATDTSLIRFCRGLWVGLAAFVRWSYRAMGRFVGLLEANGRRRRSRGQDYEPRGYGPRPVQPARTSPGIPVGRSGPALRHEAIAGGGLAGLGPGPGAARAGSAPRPPALAQDAHLGAPARGSVVRAGTEATVSRESLGAGAAGAVGKAGGTSGTLGPSSATAVAGSGPRARTGRKPYEQIALTEELLYELPPLSLLDQPNPAKARRGRQDLDDKARLLEETLASFGVGGKVVGARRGPVVTRFEFQPAPGVKVARITSLADDIALHLASEGVRIEAPIPGKHAVGIEVPNLEVSTVPLREVLEDPEVASQGSKLTVVFGKDITGRPITGDLDRLLHVLIAGATGSGKSVCINAMLASLLFRARPNEVKLLLIDPKVVELSVYEGIPHLVAPVVTDPKKAAGCLRWAVKQMEDRYELFAAAGVRDIGRYNALVAEERETAAASSTPARSAPVPWVRDGSRGAARAGAAGAAGGAGGIPGAAAAGVMTVTHATAGAAPAITAAGTVVGRAEAAELGRDARAGAGPQPLPYIVIVIDELADLMMVAPVDVEDAIWRLAQMARAAGIHLVVATQRPSVDVITGTIKANIPTRVAFAVSSQVDSRTIIDVAGAEKLVGHGDMLYMPVGTTKPVRVQGAYVSDREIEALVGYTKSQGRPRYAPDVLTAEESPEAEEETADDNLFEDAVRVVMETGQASISMLQRKLRVGYTRAGRLIDMMEEKGIVGPFEGSKAREIMMTYDQYRRSKEAARRAIEPRETPPGPQVTIQPGGRRGIPTNGEDDYES